MEANSTTTTNAVVTLRSGLPFVAEHPPEQREGGIHPDELQRPEHAEEPRDLRGRAGDEEEGDRHRREQVDDRRRACRPFHAVVRAEKRDAVLRREDQRHEKAEECQRSFAAGGEAWHGAC